MNSFLEQLNENEDSLSGKYLTFILGEEVYGLEIKVVTEIIGMQNISTVPNLPDYIKGVINLRGKIIPVIDIRLKLNKPSVHYHDRTCIIVVEIQNIPLGLIVDKVSDVANISDDCIVPPPDGRTGFVNNYIKGIGKVGNDIKLLIDCEMLMTRDLEKLKKNEDEQ